MINSNRKKFKPDRAYMHRGIWPLIIGWLIIIIGIFFGFDYVYGQGAPPSPLGASIDSSEAVSGEIVKFADTGSIVASQNWVNAQGFVAQTAGDIRVAGHLAELNIGFWLDVEQAYVDEMVDTRVDLNTFLSDCDDDGAGACALHPYLMTLPAGGIWGYDEALFFTPIICSTNCNVIEDARFNVRSKEGAWHTPIDSFSTGADYDSLNGPVATKDTFDTDVAYIADVFGFIDENGTPWEGQLVMDQTGGDTVFIGLCKGNADDITDWDCHKASSSDNQMYRFSEGDTVAAPNNEFYILQLIPSNTQKYVSPQMAMLESGKYGLWVNSVREDNAEPPTYADSARLLYFESQYPCSAFTFVDTVKGATDSSVFVFNHYSDSTSVWHYSITGVAPNVLMLWAWEMNWKDNATLPNPPRTDSTYDGGIRMGMSYDGGRHFYYSNNEIINRNYDTSTFALHLYQPSGKYDFGTNTVDLYVSGKDSTANEYEWGIGRVRVKFRDTLLLTYPLDSSKIPNDMIPATDIDWPYEWHYLTEVAVWNHDPEDSVELTFPITRDAATDLTFLFANVATGAGATAADTVWASGTIPYSFTIDSLEFCMLDIGGADIDSINLYGPANTTYTNLLDSSYFADATSKTASSVTIHKYSLMDWTANAGDRYGLKFFNDFSATNDTIYIGWIRLGGKR